MGHARRWRRANDASRSVSATRHQRGTGTESPALKTPAFDCALCPRQFSRRLSTCGTCALCILAYIVNFLYHLVRFWHYFRASTGTRRRQRAAGRGKPRCRTVPTRWHAFERMSQRFFQKPDLGRRRSRCMCASAGNTRPPPAECRKTHTTHALKVSKASTYVLITVFAHSSAGTRGGASRSRETVPECDDAR